MKIACVVGARPNFIKIAPIMKELTSFPTKFAPVLVHTGQHYDPNLSDVFFQDLEIPRPTHFLEVGAGSQAEQTAAIFTRFDMLCENERFDLVLVVGDVTSTMACAVTAAKREIPVAHVEAGLRSFDRSMPEEINRIITDSISDLLFVTEASGVKNLEHEGHPANQIYLVGNVMIDTLLANLDAAIKRQKWSSFNVERKRFGLVTLHRPSNVDDKKRLNTIVEQLGRLAEKLPLVFPVHPRTRKMLPGLSVSKEILMCDPIGYLDFVSLMEAAAVVITDSGGIQEETTVLNVPCLTLRKSTERPIMVEVATNTLIGEDPANLHKSFDAVLDGTYKSGNRPEFWDGKTSKRIADVLANIVQHVGR